MRVRVLFFGQLKEIVGSGEATFDVSEGARIEDLFSSYAEKFPRLSGFRESAAAAVNQEYATWSTALRAGDEVAFLPPVSGG
ncbi:MAG: molybdopterin converting factor subunit 1 [Candidatus Acidiferrales bacterium]